MTNASSLTEHQPTPAQTRPPAVEGPLILKPLRIGNCEIDSPIVQAALSGYSDWPMRVVARRLGAPYTIAEVLIDRFVLELKQRHKTRRHLMVSDDEHPVGGQLMGSDPQQFPAAARKLVEAGFDVIDINFGCPVNTAMGGCRGGYHLSQPEIALEIVERVRNEVPDHLPVTVKMRRGIDDSEESRAKFFRILDGAFELGAAAITVHGRTVEQKYVGTSSWDFLRDVKEHAGEKLIIGSGDVFTAQSCLDMMKYTGVDGVSVARGAIGNPWIFRQARELAEGKPSFAPNVAEQRRVLEMQRSLCAEIYDDRRVLSIMRKFGIKFAPLHPLHEQVRNAFAAGKTLTAWQAVLDDFYPLTS
ncbi:MAG: tRNA dihydrouridine synthase [Planctomycetales bacterium]|jgi:tRNA-dihydrouridine synthase B